MAVSNISAPQSVTPGYNPVVWVFDSTEKTELGFRYVVDIYKVGPGLTISQSLGTLKVAPDPEFGYGYVDLSKFLNNGISKDIILGTSSTDAVNSMLTYKVNVTEEYQYSWDFTSVEDIGQGQVRLIGSTISAFQPMNVQVKIDSDVNDYNGLKIWRQNSGNNGIIFSPFSGTASGKVYWANRRPQDVAAGAFIGTASVFNGVFSTSDFLEYDEVDYIIPQSPTSSTRKFLTNQPDEFWCTPEQDLYINFYKDQADVTNINARFQNSNGDILNRGGVWTNVFDSQIGQFAAGPNNAINLGVGTGTLPLVKADTEWYDFWLYSAGSPQLSKKMRVYIDRRCKIEDIEILFMDRLGSFSSYAFQLRSKESGSIDRKTYNMFLGEIANSGWSYAYENGGESIYYVDVEESLQLNTNWMTDAMSVYFKELLSSPITFIKLNGNYIPIIVKESGYMTERQKNKILIKATISIRFANRQMINI